MDVEQGRAGPPPGHRGLFILREVGPRPPVFDRLVHARGESGGRQVQEGDRHRRAELPAAHQG